MPAHTGTSLPRAFPAIQRTTQGSFTGKVGSAGIPQMTASAPSPMMKATPAATNLEVISKPPVQYTPEARQLKVQGDVILRVTFTAAGHVVVDGLVHGLGHGLDEEARRVAEQIRFRPATTEWAGSGSDNQHHHHVSAGIGITEQYRT